MYESGRRLTTGIAGLDVRETPVRAHRGQHSDVLRRHRVNCNIAKTKNERRHIADELMPIITDERVLHDAMEQLDHDGPKASGPNGLQLHNFLLN